MFKWSKEEVKDSQEHGDRVSGTYKGIQWDMIRNYFHVNDEGPEDKDTLWPIDDPRILASYWCGYVQLSKDDDKEKVEETCFHFSECTYEKDGKFGFDCAHAFGLYGQAQRLLLGANGAARHY